MSVVICINVSGLIVCRDLSEFQDFLPDVVSVFLVFFEEKKYFKCLLKDKCHVMEI